MAMRRVVDAEWEPTVPALVQLVAASGAPHLRAAFAAAGLDGIRPAQSAVLVPLAAGGLHASDLADRFRVSRQAVAQADCGTGTPQLRHSGSRPGGCACPTH